MQTFDMTSTFQSQDNLHRFGEKKKINPQFTGVFGPVPAPIEHPIFMHLVEANKSCQTEHWMTNREQTRAI